jgi:hypothetical protein
MAQRNSFITGCDLLSCITLFDEEVVVGSSGQIIGVSWKGEILYRIAENTTRDPLWCLFGIGHQYFDGNEKSKVLLSGSETGALQVFLDGEAVTKDITATAGIISICLTNFRVESRQNNLPLLCWEFAVGSYDEHVRTYSVTLDVQTRKVILRRTGKNIRIPGSGVWKIRPMHKNVSSSSYFVAGMYSGVHVVDFNHQSATASLSWKNEDKSSSPEENQLIYDVVDMTPSYDSHGKLEILAASFYTKSLHLCHYKWK